MELKDTFGRVHDYLRISLVDKCNLRCRYCMPENIRFLPRKSLMSADELLQIAELFVREFGVKKIRLTGGEPLLRQDAGSIIAGLGRLPVKLAITSNGLLLHEYLDLFTEVGLRSLNISLDSLQRERFAEITRRDEMPRVLENIEMALDKDFRIKLNAVVMRGVNEEEVRDFIEWTRERNLHVRFIEFMPFEGNSWKRDQVYSLEEILRDAASLGKVEKLEDGKHSTSRAYRIEGFKGTFAVISTVTEPFCGSCNRIRLTAEGKLRNCLFARGEADLLSALRKGEDLKQLVIDEILAKKARLGGLPGMEREEDLEGQLSERAMVKIGG